MKKFIALGILTSFVLSAAAFAETYAVDPAKSSVQWTASKKMGSSHTGTVGIKNGNIEVTKGQVTGGTLVIDMKTIQNKDLAGNPQYQTKLVDHLKSKDFFDVEKFSESTFKLKSVKLQKDSTYLVSGDFTMIGKTNPLEFPATFQVSQDKVTGEAKIKINRTTWGLKYGSGNFFKELTADKIISDEFEIDFKFVTLTVPAAVAHK